MTPGMKTSELLLSLVPTLVGCFVLYLGVTSANTDLIFAGTAMVLGGPGGYSISRGMAKMNAPPTPPVKLEPVPKTAEEAAAVLARVEPAAEVKDAADALGRIP